MAHVPAWRTVLIQLWLCEVLLLLNNHTLNQDALGKVKAEGCHMTFLPEATMHFSNAQRSCCLEAIYIDNNNDMQSTDGDVLSFHQLVMSPATHQSAIACIHDTAK